MSKSGGGAQEVNTGKAAESAESRDEAVQQGASDALHDEINAVVKAGKASETTKPSESQSEATRAKEIAEIQEALAKSTAAFAEIAKSVQNMFASLDSVNGYSQALGKIDYPGLAQLVEPGDQDPNDIGLMMDRFRNATSGSDAKSA